MSAGEVREELGIGVVQLQSGEDLGKNLECCARLVGEAAARGARLVVLPENFAFLGKEAGKLSHVERLGDSAAPIQAGLSRMAREARCTVVGGGMPLESGASGRPYNAALVFGEDGALVQSYRKVHLFDVELSDGTSYKESEHTLPGQAPTPVEVGGFRVGLSICYDLRFPELYRKLSEAGADVLLVPSAFTVHTGRDHWHLLLRARAVENQCYVAAAAQYGKHENGRSTYGHSLVAEPWGTVIAECPDGVGFTVGWASRRRLEEVRKSVPCLAHRVL